MEVNKFGDSDMEVSKIAESEDLVSEVTGEVLDELKELMWHELWKEMIELPGARVEVRRLEFGGFVITAKM